MTSRGPFQPKTFYDSMILCLIEPMPAGSKTDPWLAKAKPINEGGSTCVITYLRRGRKNCGEMAVKREE